MFARTEAIDFALENGLKGANFIRRWDGRLFFYYWQSDETWLRHGSGGPADEPSEGKLAQVLAGRGDGWFVSARIDGSWFWYFDSSGDRVPHDG